jgi:hypothetical protein
MFVQREIEMSRQELEELVNNKELYLELASRSIHIFPTESEKEDVRRKLIYICQSRIL